MFIDDIKKSILQEAMQGKLVKQDKNDEPASELLKKIKGDKEDFEKRMNIKSTCKATLTEQVNEIFNIPDGWERVKLQDVCTCIRGTGLSKNDIGTGDSPIILYGQLYTTYGNRVYDIDSFADKKATEKCKQVVYDYIMLPITSTSPKTEIARASIYKVKTPAYFGSDMIVLKPYIYPDFLMYLLNSSGFSQEKMKYVQGITIKHLKVDNFLGIRIPIPPLAEQKRIVAKLDELMLLLDEAEPLEEEITKLEKEFPSKLRKALLKYAIQGKLVTQDENDKSASELIKNIKEEKEKLIKDGKIKKEKTFEPITEEEKFLDLGGDCVWVRLGEIAKIDKGSTGIMKAIPGEFPMYTTAEQPITHNEYQIDGKAVMIPLVSSTGHGHASMKRLHYGEGKFAVGSILSTVQPYGDIISAKYLYCYLSTFKERLLVSQMKGIANVTLSIDAIKNVVVPIPSTKNQEKLEELVKLCDELEEQIG